MKLKQYQHLRGKIGVYALISDKKIVYIGSSCDIYTRILEHKAEGIKEFDSVTARTNTFIKNNPIFNNLITSIIEMGVICTLRPKLNIIMFNNFKHWIYSLPISEIKELDKNEIGMIEKQVENTIKELKGERI